MIHIANMKKEWRPHPKYPGYLFSRDGKCLSVKCYKRPKMVMKTFFNRDGYEVVTIRNTDNKSKQIFIHRAMAEVFLKKPFESDDYKQLQVNHKNGKKADNRLNNIEWVTPEENQRHSRHKLKNRCAIAEKSGSAKLKAKDVLEIKAGLKVGRRGIMTKLANRFNVSVSNIHAIKVGRSWDCLDQ